MDYSSNFVSFILDNELDLPFEFSYKGRSDNSAVLGITSIRDNTPDISDVTNFLDEISDGKYNYDIIVDNSQLAVCCDQFMAKDIINIQTDVLKRTSVLRNDEDLSNFLEELRFNEAQMDNIISDFSYACKH